MFSLQPPPYPIIKNGQELCNIDARQLIFCHSSTLLKEVQKRDRELSSDRLQMGLLRDLKYYLDCKAELYLAGAYYSGVLFCWGR